jgi:hypothetical protein
MSSVLAVPVVSGSTNVSNALNFSIAPDESNDYYHHRFNYRFFVSGDKTPFAPHRPPMNHFIPYLSIITAVERIGNHFGDIPEVSASNYVSNLKKVYNDSGMKDPARFNTLKRVSKRLHDKRDDHSEERRGHMRLLLFLEDSFITLLSTQTYMKQPTQIQMKRLRTHIKSSEPKIIVKYDY